MAISATNAVDALLKWNKTQSKSGNPQLLPQDDFLYLILTLKKIPQKGGINGARTNPNKIPLPHPLISSNSFSEICLIIDDRPNSKLTSEIAKKKIKSDGISVTKIMKVSKLKTNYKPHEAKRKLCDSYEMFFADKRVIPLLPKLLGKQFFRKKKLPLPVDLTHKNWKEQIERGFSSGLLFFSTGTCCVIRVAKLSMERDEIIENVNAAINGAIDFVPKKILGVRSLHLKFSGSVALPLYQCLPDIKLRIQGIKEEKQHMMEIQEEGKTGIPDELKTIAKEKYADGGSGKKKRKGDVVEVGMKKISNKGKVLEINHDSDEQEEEIENIESPSAQAVNVAKPGKKSAKGKRRKDDVAEEDIVKANPSDKKAKKKDGDSAVKKEKKKGRSVSRV